MQFYPFRDRGHPHGQPPSRYLKKVSIYIPLLLSADNSLQTTDNLRFLSLICPSRYFLRNVCKPPPFWGGRGGEASTPYTMPPQDSPLLHAMSEPVR